MNPLGPYRRTLLAGIITFFTACLAPVSSNMVSGYLTNPSEELLGKKETVFLSVAIFVVCVLVSLYANYLDRKDIKTQTEENHSSFIFPPKDQPKRKIILERVRRYFIDQDLQSRLDRTGEFIPLRLSSKPNAVKYPADWAQHDTKSSIAKAYEHYQGQMLLLGEPGAGKTTLLLTLAEQILIDAEADKKEQKPIPVVLNLYAWREKHSLMPKHRGSSGEIADDTRFETWAAEQLDKSPYNIGIKVARQWLRDRALVILLDGLDEVASEQQAACVAAIDAYRKKQGNAQAIIVSCRRHAYEGLNAKLSLNGAVAIEPPTINQTNAFLKRKGRVTESLRAVLRDHPELYDELFSTPLFLYVATEAYANQSAVELAYTATRQEREWRLWEAYIVEMFSREKPQAGKTFPYTEKQARLWLARLASYLNRRDQQKQKVYYIEETGTSLLPKRWDGGVLRIQVFCYFLVFMPTMSIAFWYGYRYYLNPWVMGAAATAQTLWVSWWLNFLVRGEIAENVYKRFRGSHLNKAQRFEAAIVGLLMGFISGSLMALLGGISFWLYNHRITGIAVSAVSTERFATVSGFVWFLTGAIVGFFVKSDKLSQEEIAAESQKPNIAIIRLLKQAGIAAVVGGTLQILYHPLYSQVRAEPFVDKTTEIVILSTNITLFAAFGAFAFGGSVALQHYLLRLLLWKTGTFPRDITKFMDYCADRILVQRSGGGWKFIHATLQDHFAAHYEKQAQPETEVPPPPTRSGFR